uniref:Peptidase M56, BlaR1 n=1 Tax=Solibacter usitatus (strain Ellin6076) TaxID=234267 RepID=Q01V79_SOLUE
MTPLLEAFSAALLHFAWQGCLIMALLWVTLFVLRAGSAKARYTSGCAALALIALAPLLTTFALYRAPASVGLATAPFNVLPSGIAHSSSAPRTSVLAAIQSWALPAWAFGVLLFSLRMVWGCAQVAALKRRGQPVGDEVLSLVVRLRQRMGIHRQARVLVSEWSGGPSLVGWLRPVILLPAAALAGLTPQQLEAVLAHELAHIRRHDYLVNWMQMLVETLLFYHPAVWWISSRVRHERELCCDDLAVSACEGALCYARALTMLEKLRVHAPVTALGSTDGALLYRIQRIAGVANHEYGPSRAPVVVTLSLAVAGLVFSVNWARAQSQPANDYMSQGDTLLRSGVNELALQKYMEGVAADPAHRATLQKRCIEAYMRMGRKAEAADVNAQLLKEHPHDTDGLAFGATILLDQGNVAAAIAQLQQVLERAPDNPVAHFDLGRAYIAQGDLMAARREIEEAIALRPDFTRARQALERLSPGAGGDANEDELARLQSESAKAPERLDLLQSLGTAAVRAGKFDLAIYAYQKLLDRTREPSELRGELYLKLGDAYVRKGDSAAALDAMQKARELAPGNRLVLGPLLTLLDGAGRHAEANQLRAGIETVAAHQAELTTQFLNDEVAAAEQRLAKLRLQPSADAEKIRQAEFQLFELKRKASASPQLQPTGRVLESIFVAGMTEAMRKQFRVPVHVGDTLTQDTIGATYSAVKLFDSSLELRFLVQANGRVRLLIGRQPN